MIFYRIEAFITDRETVDRFGGDHRCTLQASRMLAAKTEEFNNKVQGGSILVSEIIDEILTGCAVIESKDEFEKIRDDFFNHIGITVTDFSSEEITIMEFRNLVECADRHSFIRDSDDIFEEYRLDRLNPRGFRGIDFGENLFDTDSRKKITKIAERNLVGETFLPEIERIYAGKVIKGAKGHPVQYIIRTDDHDIRNSTYRSLLSALYDNNRLDSRRYAYLDFRPGNFNVSGITYDSLYECAKGGAIVIRFFGDDSSDDDYASGENQMLEMIARNMRRYRNSVLTVVCFERECTKAKETLLDYLGNVSVVEIEEELVKEDRAKNYLRLLAKESNVKADTKLLSKIEDDKLYLSNDLKEIFESWYDDNLKKCVFPQYKECVSARQEAAKQKPKGSAYDALQEMIGLDEAKSVIQKALNFYKMQKIYSDKGICTERPAMHMVFTGNPGTAKTTAARLFARIMKENGLLSKGNLIEVGRSDLVARYVGWTAKTIKDKFNEALGSVLFIDEAYSLVDDRSGSFGDEAINTIVQEMENHRDELVVIFAGYPDKMEDFLNKNPGLRSRIAFHVPFSDYNTEELGRIAEVMCEHLGTKLTEEAKDKLSGIFDGARACDDYGNGRYVRNVLEMARMNQAGRILQMDVDSVTEDDLHTIEAEDIEAPVLKHESKQAKSIGFCA